MSERATRARLLLTCEHGGNRVPARYAPLFAGRGRLLASHRALDAGALALARHLRRELGAPLIEATLTRLLVDLNRSESHPSVFSELSRGLPPEERERILARHHRPHRAAVRAAVEQAAPGAVVHLSVHSFTPRLRGEVRRADVGLLYDPARPIERRLCAGWKRALAARAPALRVRRNYPYRGTSDGLTTTLRGVFAPERYAGIELEINQALLRDADRWRRAMAVIAAALAEALAHPPLDRFESPRRPA